MDRLQSTPGRMVGSVMVTCIVASAALTFTYQLTRDRIAEQERIARETALQAVLPQAGEFIALPDEEVEEARVVAGETRVDGLFEAPGDGWGVLVAPRGYGGPMSMVIGVDRDGKVTGVRIITQNETPGLGTKVLTEPGFLDQFEGWNAGDVETAAKAFDAVSGATKSSNGVRKGVLAAGHIYADVLSDGGGGGAQ